MAGGDSSFKKLRSEGMQATNSGIVVACVPSSPAGMKLSLSPAIRTGVECPLPSFHDRAAQQALIKYTPQEQFWMQCLAAAVRSNAMETWIVMPASQGGQVFQLSLLGTSTATSSSSTAVRFEVSEVFPEAFEEE